MRRVLVASKGPGAKQPNLYAEHALWPIGSPNVERVETFGRLYRGQRRVVEFWYAMVSDEDLMAVINAHAHESILIRRYAGGSGDVWEVNVRHSCWDRLPD